MTVSDWRDSDIVFDSWLDVVDAQGQVVHTTQHAGGGAGWLWDGTSVPVPDVVLFVHVRWLVSRLVGARVVGLLVPQFDAWCAGH